MPSCRGDFASGRRDAVVSNDGCKARHNGADNPNIAAQKELYEAGVSSACADRVSWEDSRSSQLLPGVEADLWAMVAMVILHSRVRASGLTAIVRLTPT